MKLLTEAESLEQSVLKLKTMDWPILMSHDTVALEILTATLRSQVDDRKAKVPDMLKYLDTKYLCSLNQIRISTL